MNVARLLHLITILKDVATKHKSFYMGAWATIDHAEGAPNLCGTSCCALGWAALDKANMDEGLNIMAVWTEYPSEHAHGDEKAIHLFTNADWVTAVDKNSDHDVTFTPYFNGNVGFAAGSAYYDITMDQADYLFDPGSYRLASSNITPHDVIERVRDILNGHPGVMDDDDDEVDIDSLVVEDQVVADKGFE